LEKKGRKKKSDLFVVVGVTGQGNGMGGIAFKNK
jgi:hypothetical protein